MLNAPPSPAAIWRGELTLASSWEFAGNAGFSEQERFPVLPGVSRMTDMVMREQTTKMTSRAMAMPFQFL